ncbi:MAG: HlyD family secretion protein [Nitrospirae bacterium]|nr:MAG: HlyD family secretion protein [Nitrospirota bacterium]
MDEIRPEEKTEPNNGRRKTVGLSLVILITIAGLISVFFYLRYKSTHISTDDAFIEGRVHTIASKVPGTVRTITVEHNQMVRKGDLLIEIDDADHQARLSEAVSGLETERSRLAEGSSRVEVAKKQMSELRHRVEAARANLDLQEATLRQAEADMKRAGNLLSKEVISKERHEKTRTAHDVAAAQVRAARDQLRQAESSVETQASVIRQSESFLQSQASVIRQREAGKRLAELQSGYTRIVAPADGYITKKSVEAGNQVQSGQPLMAVVPLDDIWIIANYKETQLEKVKPGQKVKISVDMHPGVTFDARVDSIMAGTGSAFSLFPSENATGNFVKVVQRVPVRMVFEKNRDPKYILRIGMSAEPTIIIE